MTLSWWEGWTEGTTLWLHVYVLFNGQMERHEEGIRNVRNGNDLNLFVFDYFPLHVFFSCFSRGFGCLSVLLLLLVASLLFFSESERSRNKSKHASRLEWIIYCLFQLFISLRSVLVSFLSFLCVFLTFFVVVYFSIPMDFFRSTFSWLSLSVRLSLFYNFYFYVH